MTDDAHTKELEAKVAEACDRWEGNADNGRPRASVFTSVEPTPVGKPNPWHNGGTGTNAEVPAASIIIEPPATEATRGRVAGFSPVKIGYLVDIDSGALLGDCLDAAILACEDALADGELFRPIEIIPKIARGLPRAEARIAVSGYEELCDEGCLVVLGPYITDNGMALLPAMERRGVPMISTNGAKAYNSYYGFTTGNGGVSEEGAMMAGWLREKGHQRVAMITEISPGGREYSAAFRASATRNRLDVVAELLIETTGQGLVDALRTLRDEVKPDAIAYCGYGYPTAMFNPILHDLDFDPPRVMSTAFMWYINVSSMLDDLEGWVGVDQVGDEKGDPNPNFWPTMNRFERRFGRKVIHAMVGCSYDQTRVAIAGIAAASLLDPAGVVLGLETVTMHPTVIGGPRSYISFGPYDRKGFKGDFLSLRRVVNGVPEFEGYLSTLYPATIDEARAASAS
jgi:ABC-type branched-subunit amino acid transport system substrate-binding protein